MKARSDRGESLVELLVAVIIMGTAAAVLVGGVAVSIRIVDIHRKQAAAGAYVRDFAEKIETAVASPTSGYVSCASPGSYQLWQPADTRYRASVTAVTYWDAASSQWIPGCSTDPGVQRVSLSVRSLDAAGNVDNRANEKLDLVIRRPCRTGDTPCPTTP